MGLEPVTDVAAAGRPPRAADVAAAGCPPRAATVAGTRAAMAVGHTLAAIMAVVGLLGLAAGDAGPAGPGAARCPAATPAVPVASGAPVVPVASVAPVVPVASVAPVVPVASVAPVVPVASAGSVGSAAPVGAAARLGSPAPVVPAVATTADLRTVGLRIEPNVPFDGGKLAVWFARSAVGDQLVVSLGRRDAAGDLAAYGVAVGTPAGLAEQPAGRPAVGFHRPADAAAGMHRPLAYALFGLVVGEVDTVGVKVGGRVAEASLATWSEDPLVHVWWVLGPPLPAGSPAPPRTEVTELVAYGRDGVALFGGPAPGC